MVRPIPRRLVEFVERRVDKLLISTGESVKTFAQEAWRLFFRVFVFFVTILLGFIHKPAFEKWVQEHRHRIQPIFVDSELDDKTKEPTSFASLLTEDSPVVQSPQIELLSDEDDQEGSNLEVGTQAVAASPSSRRHAPTRSKRKLKYDKLVHTKDRVFSSQKINTGVFEDLRIRILLRIDSVVNGVRTSFHQFFEMVKSITFTGALLFFPRLLLTVTRSLRPSILVVGIVSFIFRVITGIAAMCINLPLAIKGMFVVFPVDKRDTRDLATSQGYPYEKYDVITEDGYILSLERLPQRKSSKVLYFQHGVVDTSFAWFGHIEGEAASALAFRAYDQGYDVFVGTLRGCGGSTAHIDPTISKPKFWDFTVNEHAFQDLPAFVNKIRELKLEDLGLGESGAPSGRPAYNLTFIAHSMGAMATLMYLVFYRIMGKDHGVSGAILLSPAGYHKTAPRLAKLVGPVIDRFLRIYPSFSVFRFPSETMRVLIAKIIEDLNSSYTGRIFVSWFISKVIGGNLEDHTFVNMHDLTYNIFTGTSTGIFKHFWQNWLHQRFEAFDYGPAVNLEKYGTETPINFMENYDKIDIPVHFVMGLNDTLIEPTSIITQYAALKDRHPELAYLKAFPRLGHIDFTVGANEKLIAYILQTLKKLNK